MSSRSVHGPSSRALHGRCHERLSGMARGGVVAEPRPERDDASMSLVVREMAFDEVDLVIDYFHGSTREHLETLGVDPTRLPTRDDWRAWFVAEYGEPVRERSTLLVIWELDGVAVGSRHTRPSPALSTTTRPSPAGYSRTTDCVTDGAQSTGCGLYPDATSSVDTAAAGFGPAAATRSDVRSVRTAAGQRVGARPPRRSRVCGPARPRPARLSR